jgi:hypothetical protein
LGFISEYVGVASSANGLGDVSGFDGGDPATQDFNASGLSLSDYVSVSQSSIAVAAGISNFYTAMSAAASGGGGGSTLSQSGQPVAQGGQTFTGPTDAAGNPVDANGQPIEDIVVTAQRNPQPDPSGFVLAADFPANDNLRNYQCTAATYACLSNEPSSARQGCMVAEQVCNQTLNFLRVNPNGTFTIIRFPDGSTVIVNPTGQGSSFVPGVPSGP